ncbi:MAG: CDP-glycerol glycerophosphotransferase family protein [Clostridia bacterium]|nr:CDP-glycerol glycerophosphotransferase family protein [Clostridia bacterium]
MLNKDGLTDMLGKIKKIFKHMIELIDRKILYLFYRFYPLHNTFLLESVPDISDNTKAVYDEMVRRGINEKYKIIWLVKNTDCRYPETKNVSYYPLIARNHKERKKLIKVKLTCKYLISCNFFLTTERRGQISFYLGHGSAIKSIRSYYNMPKNIDHCLAASSDMVNIMSYEMKTDKSKFFALGYPRNDVLCKPGMDLHNVLNKSYKKVIVWYPTFRQHSSGGSSLTKNALPIIHDLEKAISLNDYAKEKGILIVIKPHFAQDLSYIKNTELSNIVFIDESLFIDNKISSYEFVAGCDALVTDYSSIYYDYTLCDKPMALVWEDYKEYESSVGFAVDMDEYMKGAEIIYTLDDFKVFIEHLSFDIDIKKAERNEIKNLVNYSDDGKSSVRVVDFIFDKIHPKTEEV